MDFVMFIICMASGTAPYPCRGQSTPVKSSYPLISISFELFYGALVKHLTVNIRDGQNLTAITEASRICHVAVTDFR